MPSTARTRSEPRPLDALLLAVAALCGYVLLAQGSFYKVDGQALLQLSRAGEIAHPYHGFYLLLLEQAKKVCMPFEASLFETATWLSAFGTAVAVYVVHFASARLRLDRVRTNLVTALFALSPGVVFFATIVETPGVFLPFGALALLGAAHATRRPRWHASLLFGLLLAIAYVAHPSGALVLFLLPCVQAVAIRISGVPIPLARRAAVFAMSGATFAALLVLLSLLPIRPGSPGGGVDLGTTTSVFRAFSHHGFSFQRIAEVVVAEWFLPCLVSSVLAPIALRWSPGRPQFVWLLVGLAPYVVGTQLMLSDYSERGAYLLPVAWPTALVALETIRHARVLAIPALALSAGFAVGQVELHDRPERPRLYAEGLREVTGGAEFQILAGHEWDVEAHFVELYDTPMLYVGLWASQPPHTLDPVLRGIDQWIEVARREGQATFMSELGLSALRHAAARGQWPLSHDPELWVDGAGAARILRHLESSYRMEPVDAWGFSGVRLVPAN